MDSRTAAPAPAPSAAELVARDTAKWGAHEFATPDTIERFFLVHVCGGRLYKEENGVVLVGLCSEFTFADEDEAERQQREVGSWCRLDAKPAPIEPWSDRKCCGSCGFAGCRSRFDCSRASAGLRARRIAAQKAAYDRSVAERSAAHPFAE